MKSSLIILTLNEIEAITKIFPHIPFKLFDECFVVDGGSTDGTIEYFNKKKIKVYIQDKPGHGEAYKFGAVKAKGDVIVFFSGDGNEKPQDIPLMLNEIKKGPDLVIASRFTKNSKTFDAGVGRKFGNRLFTFLVNLIWNGNITDVFNAFRAVNRKSFLKLHLESSFFDTELEMAIKSLQNGYKIVEFPTIELNRIGGKAKLLTWKDGKSNLLRIINELNWINWVNKYVSMILLTSICIAAALLGFPIANIYPMDSDELARVLSALNPFSLIAPGSIALSLLSGQLLHGSNIGYRIPSLIYSMLSIPAIYFFAKRLFGSTAGLIAAFILTLSYTNIGYSIQAKEYSALMFYSIISSFIAYEVVLNHVYKKILLLLLGVTWAISIFFGSYVMFLLIPIQVLIMIFSSKWVKDLILVRKLKESREQLNNVSIVIFTLTTLGVVVFSRLSINITFPDMGKVIAYFSQMNAYISQNTIYSRYTLLILLIGIIMSFFKKKIRHPFLFLLGLITVDLLLIHSISFKDKAFPIRELRYNSFLLPIFIIIIAGSISLISKTLAKNIFKLLKIIVHKKDSILILLEEKIIFAVIVSIFLFFNVFLLFGNRSMWVNTSSLENYKPNFEDAGKYLSLVLKPEDTLVRIKKLEMIQKVNFVNRYVDSKVLSNSSYSIFPNRTSNNNWYVNVKVDDNDYQGFSDYFWVEKIKPTLRLNDPYIYKMKYYGPLYGLRKINYDFKPTFEEDSVIIDLGNAHYINLIDFNFSLENFSSEYTVNISLDGLIWKRVYTYFSPGYISSPFSKIYIEPQKAKFIKIDFFKSPMNFSPIGKLTGVEVYEIYEKQLKYNREEIVNAEPLVRYNFSSNTQDWKSKGIGLTSVNGKLHGLIEENTPSDVYIYKDIEDALLMGDVNVINFSLKINNGQKIICEIKTDKNRTYSKEFSIIPDGLLRYYSINLRDLKIDTREKIIKLIFIPDDIKDSEFDFDFISLDRKNLNGIQVKDDNSKNGYAQFIPYDPNVNYEFFQIGEEMQLPAGTYEMKFKIKADNIDKNWTQHENKKPDFTLNYYIEPFGSSKNDILYVSIESTKPTFYDTIPYILLDGHNFLEANTYYEYKMKFKSDGKEKLFIQAYSPRNRRYPANLYITFPVISKIEK